MEDKQKIIQDQCEELLNDLKDDLKWEWDDRFEALLTKFNITEQDSIQSTLKKHLIYQWDNKTIKKAPHYIRKKSGPFSDLRMGQLLFTVDSDKSFILAVWWPWGDNENISLRLASSQHENLEGSAIINNIKSLFIRKS